MIALACAALVVAALGSWRRPVAPPLARWLAFGAALAFAVVALLAPGTAWRPAVVAPARADVAGDAAAVAAALLRAAAGAGPRADDLAVVWRGPVAAGTRSAPAVLGARASAPPAMPFAPGDLSVRADGEAAVGRPLRLEVDGPELPAPLAAELVVQGPGGAPWRAPVALGAGRASVEFTPAAVGPHAVALRVDVRGHTVRAGGRFDVGEPRRVLVLEPSGAIAAALAAQGVAVDRATALPEDLRGHAALVLGQPVPEAAQPDVVAAVLDGLGLFVLAPGFGAPGEPLRALLPVRPLPPPATGDGRGGAPRADASPAPPAETPPPPEPAREPPPSAPIGPTAGAKPVSPEPIDVDKHSIAMVLVVDRSGSMGNLVAGGQSRMSYAKTSALKTAQALGEGDRVGLVTFGDKEYGRVELPMTDASDAAAIRGGIERLAHGPEYTFLLSGLRKAHELLAPVDAAVKHVVVVTDGEFDMRESNALRAEANRMRRMGRITVSIVAIVHDDTDPAFKRAAELLTQDGGGQFLPINDPRQVPVFVSAEVTRALSRVGRKPRRADGDGDGEPVASPTPPPPEPAEPTPEPEPAPAPPPSAAVRLAVRAVAASPLLAPSPTEWPTLGGATATEAPLEARVLLVAGDDGWPLLAFANRGLGRVGAFAADLGGDDGALFRRDAAFPAWLAQWVQSVGPAVAATQPRQLLVDGAIVPPAPVPRELAWLADVAGAPATTADAAADEAGRAMPATDVPVVVDRIAPAARWLLPLLLLLAVAERLAATWVLRRVR